MQKRNFKATIIAVRQKDVKSSKNYGARTRTKKELFVSTGFRQNIFLEMAPSRYQIFPADLPLYLSKFSVAQGEKCLYHRINGNT